MDSENPFCDGSHQIAFNEAYPLVLVSPSDPLMFVTRYWRADHLRVAGQESGGGMLDGERV
jgi:hypothetical protein